MIIENYPEKIITQQIILAEKEERENHVSSGKLSASMLGDPLQWQILKMKGILPPPPDEYVLRKFQRGKHVEEWFIKMIEPINTQVFCEYRNTVGYMDALVDTRKWDFPKDAIPLEVKSVTNMKFKNILREGKPQRGHALQACLYALATRRQWFAITYIASDDYRTHTFLLPVYEWQDEVDRIITRFEEQMATGEIPPFVPEETWQGNLKYNRYPDYIGDWVAPPTVPKKRKLKNNK